MQSGRVEKAPSSKGKGRQYGKAGSSKGKASQSEKLPTLTLPTTEQASIQSLVFENVFTVKESNLWAGKPTGLNLENAVLKSAFALASRILTNDHSVQAYDILCVQREVNNKSYPSKKDLDAITATIIKGHIQSFLPPIVVPESMEEIVYIRASLSTHSPAEDKIEFNKEFLALALRTDITEYAKLCICVLTALKLAHEVAHVLMFRVGYQSKLTKAEKLPKTPGGRMFSEAGHAFEFALTGRKIILIGPKESQMANCFGLAGMDTDRVANVVPLDWMLKLVSDGFWQKLSDETELTINFDGPESPVIPSTQFFKFALVSGVVEEEAEILDEGSHEERDVGDDFPEGAALFESGPDKRES